MAGTLTDKPYLFNAENVARYAPQWASAGTAIDRCDDELDRLARVDTDVGAQPGAHAALTEPPLLDEPPADGQALPIAESLELLHPWSLARRQPQRTAARLLVREFHRRHAWSARRWDFVLGRLRELGVPVVLMPAAQVVATVPAGRVVALHTRNPHYALAPAQRAQQGTTIERPARLFDDPPPPCRSFSRFWRIVAAGAPG